MARYEASVRRRELMLAALTISAALSAKGLRGQPLPAATVANRRVMVPVDHENRKAGSFSLDVFVVDGQIIDEWPTIFIVGDGQQFYIRPSEMPKFRTLFGTKVNIVGIAGRGFSGELLKRLGSPVSSSADWALAHQLLKDLQWTADIEEVRRKLLGPDRKVLIFGVSGGGFLLHAYMSRYGQHVSSAYSEVAALPPIEAALHLQHDHFWAELPPAQREMLWSAISQRPLQRPFYAQLLQRQNYFVPLDRLQAARADLIVAIERNYQGALSKAAEDYQVAAIQKMLTQSAAWPIRVREYEFIWPIVGEGSAWKDTEFRPDVEVSEAAAEPLLKLRREGRIAAPNLDLKPLNDLTAEMLIVCGRYDHISDYREQIAISGHYRNSQLLILDDDHILHKWKAIPGARTELLRAWVAGFESKAFEVALATTAPLIWREN